jgi:pimeloyl-ACP methyl ester carboxylesterase
VEIREVRLADGTVISCQLSGRPGAPAMVLLHALGEQAASWDEVVPQFATWFQVVALDLRGHGASTWPGAYSFPLMRDDVLGVLDVLDLHDVVLVGHSMGGTVAYLVALAQPARVARLVVEDAPPPFPRERAVPARPAGELPFDWAVVPAIFEEVNDPSRRWWRHLPEIEAATLLVGGGPASSIPQDLLVDVCRAVPDCTLVTIPVGHDVHDAAPATFAETVLDWLGIDRGVPGPGPSR